MSAATMLKNSRLMPTLVCISSMSFPADGGLGKLIFRLSLVYTAKSSKCLSLHKQIFLTLLSTWLCPSSSTKSRDTYNCADVRAAR
jgi:hypothetical protein